MNHLSPVYQDSLRLEGCPEGRAFLSLIAPLLESPAVARLSSIRHHRTTCRLQHAVSVAYLTYHLCRKRGLRAEEAARAALLHDLFYFDRRSSADAPRFLLCRHPQIALQNARELTPLCAVGEDIIARHMWPLGPRPRTREGRIASRMDKYCALREFSAGLFPRRKTTKGTPTRDRKTEAHP